MLFAFWREEPGIIPDIFNYEETKKMNDTEFDDMLRRARGDVPLPDSFRRDVWNRIAGEEQRTPMRWFRSLVDDIVRPWSAVCGVAAMVALGLWLGALGGPPSTDTKMVYAESVSPFLQAGQK